jgi:hypothetical protein
MIRGRTCRFAALLLSVGVLLGSTGVGVAVAAPNTGGTVLIQTVPGLSGVQLSVSGRTVVTGAGGTASVPVSDLNGIASRVTLANDQLDAADTLAITKVDPAPHVAQHESQLYVGLNITSPVTLSLESGTTGVPAGLIKALRLHSVNGQILTVNPQATPTIRLQSRDTRLVTGTLSPQVVTWSVDSVTAVPGVSVRARQPGFDPFGHTSWPLQLQTVHGTIGIDTIPKTPGVMFSLEGAIITTDAIGSGQGVVTDLNNVADRIQLATPTAGPATVSVLRVVKQPAGAPGQRHLLVALAVRRTVQFGFVDASGQSVPASQVSEVKVTSGGTSANLTGPDIAKPVSLLAQTATEDGKVWQSRQLTYTVSTVRINGSNAVFAGRQAFNPNTAASWRISLAVFPIKIAVRDVLFGSRISSSAWVTRPDGSRYPVHLGAGAPTVLTSLVRGSYDVQVRAAVIGSHTRLLVSRPDQVNLRVITRTDVLVMLFAVLALGGGVVWLGLHFRRSLRRRSGSVEICP